MRIDHHAYQQATRVAGFGFLVQLGIGLTLLIFSLVGTEAIPQDTAFLFGSLYILLGVLAWVGLIVVFNQHRLERLEALEEDELEATRAPAPGGESVFADEEIRVAARRLRLMHHWLMPIVSLVIAAGLALMAWGMLRHMARVSEGAADFHRTDHIGWAVAICLAFSALSFIVSRFVAGMARQPAWQNLRGGAAYMVGNALVTLGIAVGIGFRFFHRDQIVTGVAYAIPIFMLVVAAEIVLNFILNLYRPRVPGETPRPAFDSKLLSLFSAPDSLVRSINEAVNYQFGFDITSSWGYQLLIRSFAWLIGLGVLAVVLLNTIVIVEPQQQAIKLSHGRRVGDGVHASGVMWKLPWPFETAELYDVTTIRSLHLTGRQVKGSAVQLWTDKLGQEFDKRLVPFIVGSSRRLDQETLPVAVLEEPHAAEAEGSERLSSELSLVDAEIVLQYRIREDGGLLDWLDLAPGDRGPAGSMRERTLRAIALGEIGQELSRLTVDQVLAGKRADLATRMGERVQRAFDEHRTGVELVSVDLPLLRPAGDASSNFEELSISYEARKQFVANAEQQVVAGLAKIVGDPDAVDKILAEIDAWSRLSDTEGPDGPATIEKKVAIETQLVRGGGYAAQLIDEAERDGWVRLMEARGDASRVRGQIQSYRAAPRLYRERETMLVYQRTLPNLYKYVLCVDPARVSFDVDLKELSSVLSFSDAMEKDEKGNAQ